MHNKKKTMMLYNRTPTAVWIITRYFANIDSNLSGIKAMEISACDVTDCIDFKKNPILETWYFNFYRDGQKRLKRTMKKYVSL